MTHTCIICTNKFDPANTKPEHILLNALGGKKTTKAAICSACNEKAGTTIDNAMAKSVEAIRNFCNWRSGDGDDAPTFIGVDTEKGTKINLGPGGVPDDRRVEFKKTSTEDGRVQFTGGVTGYKRLSAMIPHIAKQLGITSERVLEELTNNGMSVHVKQPPTLKLNLTFGGNQANASALKMGFVLWSDLVGNEQASSSVYEVTAQFLKKIIEEPDQQLIPPMTLAVPDGRVPQGLKLPEEFASGEHYSILHVFSDDQGVVTSWLRLYNTINFIAVIGTDVNNKNRSATLFSNPDTLISAHKRDFDIGIDKNFLKSTGVDYEAARAAFLKLVDYGYEQMEKTAANNMIEDSMYEAFPGEGESIEQEHISDLSQRLAQGMVASQMGLDHTKTIPKEKALEMLRQIEAGKNKGKK